MGRYKLLWEHTGAVKTWLWVKDSVQGQQDGRVIRASTAPWSDAELGVDVCLLASRALDIHNSVHWYNRNDPGRSNLSVHIGVIYVHKLTQITLIWKLVCKASNPKLIPVSQAAVASFKCQGHISCHLNPMCSVLSSWRSSVEARCHSTSHLICC